MYSKDKKAFEDSIGIEEYKGKYRLNLARKHSRNFYGTNQKRIATGLSICKENLGKVEQTCLQIHYDLLSNNFDVSLVKYGLGKQTQLTVIEGIKKEISLLELYDWYCESKRDFVSETYLELTLKKTLRSAILETINTVGENDAIAIRGYLIKHRCSEIAKNALSNLDKAYRLGIKHKGITNNPFFDMAEEITLPKKNKKTANNFDDETEDSDTKAFTFNEGEAIIKAFESPKRSHYSPIIKFLFWTGCRTGEAIALKWRDIKWDNELIVIRRTYNQRLKIFKPTKTGIRRFFPMPKNGQLWNLLKSLPQEDSDNIIFKSKNNNVINRDVLSRVWRGDNKIGYPGVIPELIKQGKVKEYLELYATRHTFVSIQKNVYKVPIETIAQWVGNGAMVSYNHYLERDKLAKPGESNNTTQEQQSNNELPNQVTEFLSGLTTEQIEQLKALLNK